MSDDDRGSFSRERRTFLQVVGAGAGCVAGASLLATAGCSASKERTAVALADLPLGVRTRVLDGEIPVELIRDANGVKARSLWCTHSGCEVRWMAERQEYLCPCHDGAFDADGQVTAGPPPRALEDYPIEVTDREVLLGAVAGRSS